jgi:hypothetical protein
VLVVAWPLLVACQETEKLSADSVEVLAPALDCWAPRPSDTNPGPVVELLLPPPIRILVAVHRESAIPPVCPSAVALAFVMVTLPKSASARIW